MNYDRLYREVSTALSIARVQSTGHPDAVTSGWSEADFDRWHTNQRRTNQRHFRLHGLQARIVRRMEGRPMRPAYFRQCCGALDHLKQHKCEEK
jgi:hypothetical protein